ncbi:PAS domain-containing protein [Dongia sp. agr-C8]
MPNLIADPLQVPASPLEAADSRVAVYVAHSGRSVLPADQAAPETPEARALWSWWRGAASGGRQPHRNDFDVVENRQLAANLYLIEPVAGGFRLRLAGEVFEQLFRRSRGHAWLRDSSEPLARAFAGYFDFVTEQAQPYRSLGRMKCEYSDWFSFESLLCPLRHEDGDQLLGVAARVPEPGL